MSIRLSGHVYVTENGLHILEFVFFLPLSPSIIDEL